MIIAAVSRGVGIERIKLMPGNSSGSLYDLALMEIAGIQDPVLDS